jgi:hypothetical protein
VEKGQGITAQVWISKGLPHGEKLHEAALSLCVSAERPGAGACRPGRGARRGRPVFPARPINIVQKLVNAEQDDSAEIRYHVFGIIKTI